MIPMRFLLQGLLVSLLMACSEQSPTESPAETLSRAAQKLTVAESFEVGKGVIVRALAKDEEQGQIWVGTSVGALRIDGHSGQMLNTYTRENGLANEYVFASMVDRRGDVWLGTNGGGVSWLSGEKWRTLFPMHGLADYWVYSFTEQANGDIWIGTWAGLNRYRRDAGAMTTYLKELVNEWVYGLDVDSSDRVWIGTEGGVNMFDGKTWHVWTHKDGLGAPNSLDLPFSANTGLGTRSRHDLSILSAGRETYNPNYVFCIKVDKQDRVWAGTWGGGVSVYDGQEWKSFTQQDGLSGDIVYAIEEDEQGVLWFGTDKGLSRFDGNSWDVLGVKEGLLDQHVYAVLATKNGAVWTGTRHGVTKIISK